MSNIEYTIFTKADGYHVGWIGEHHTCSKFGPFKTEDQANRVCAAVNKERTLTPAKTMKTLTEFYDKIDLALLSKQKEWLYEAIIWLKQDKPLTAEALDGILNLLDYIEDTAIDTQ